MPDRASAHSSSPRRIRGSTRRSGVHPHDAAKVDDAGWAGIAPRGERLVRGGNRRDGPGLRPGLLADPGPADESAAQPGACARDRQAGDPALPLGRWQAGRPGRTPRRAAGGRSWRRSVGRGLRGAAAGRHPLVLRAAGLCPRRPRPRARDQLLGPRVPPWRGGLTRGRRASCPSDRLLVETDSPFLAPPGAPRSRNEPEWVQGDGCLGRRSPGADPELLGESLVAAYDRTFPRSRARA